MKRFRGGLVFKAHRLVYHSTLGSRVIKKKQRSFLVWLTPSGSENMRMYRGTSLIRNTPLLGPYSRTIPRVLWWS